MASTFFWCLMAALLVGTLGFPFFYTSPYAMSYRRPFYGRYRSPMYRRSFRSRRFPRYRRYGYWDSDYYDNYSDMYSDYYENRYGGDYYENRYGGDYFDARSDMLENRYDGEGGYYGRF